MRSDTSACALPATPGHYFISRYVSAGVVKAGDIIENDLDSQPVAGPRSDEYQEVYMHGEIYKARPDVMAVLHAHTPEILAFTESSVALRPVVNGGAFIGDGLPLHDIRKFDPRETLIRTPALGRSVAMVLGNKPGVLLKGHGIALTDASLRLLVVQSLQPANERQDPTPGDRARRQGDVSRGPAGSRGCRARRCQTRLAPTRRTTAAGSTGSTSCPRTDSESARQIPARRLTASSRAASW